MTNEPNPTTDPSQPMIYEIRIKGHLGDQWTDWFEGMTHHPGRKRQYTVNWPGG